MCGPQAKLTFHPLGLTRSIAKVTHLEESIGASSAGETKSFRESSFDGVVLVLVGRRTK